MTYLTRQFLKGLCQRRCFSTTKVRFIDPKSVEEVKIPVPWGHIAGKWWGKKDVQPILAIHGWQDNAGSWDPLAELIPEEYSLLAIDLPGNGFSSHLPPFQNYYTSDTVAVISRIKRHFGFGKLNLLGHSGGSTCCFLYAAVFPENTASYFGVDYVINCYKDEEKRANELGKIIDKKIELGLREHSASRSYSWDEAKDVWIKATRNSLDDRSAQILMIRGLTKVANGNYIFSRDHRLKTDDINIFNPEQVQELAENVDCHVHLVKGLQSHFFQSSLKNIPELLNFIKKKAKSFSYSELVGKHHLHMDIPEQILPLLLDNLKRAGTELSS